VSRAVLARRIAAKDSGSRAGEPNRATRFCRLATRLTSWKPPRTPNWRGFPRISSGKTLMQCRMTRHTC